ncbi:MAG: hypothetical protein KAX13_12805 [Candidatus Krumholzibacteria bacterium]|nr:hypothetical protein [Candidatus Krumholzibacteria bacterium]
MCNATAGPVRIDFHRRVIVLGAGIARPPRTVITSSGDRRAGIGLHLFIIRERNKREFS